MTENKENKEQPLKRQKKRCQGKDQEIKKDKKQTQRLQNLLRKCWRVKVKN